MACVRLGVSSKKKPASFLLASWCVCTLALCVCVLGELVFPFSLRSLFSFPLFSGGILLGF